MVTMNCVRSQAREFDDLGENRFTRAPDRQVGERTRLIRSIALFFYAISLPFCRANPFRASLSLAPFSMVSIPFSYIVPDSVFIDMTPDMIDRGGRTRRSKASSTSSSTERPSTGYRTFCAT
jgi:hypothetical protein